MGEGRSIAVTMKCAPHKPGSIKMHLGYERMSLGSVQEALEGRRATTMTGQAATSTAPATRGTVLLRGVPLHVASEEALLQASVLIAKELQKRKRSMA